MKWFPVLILAAAVLSFTACSDDDDDPVDPGIQEFIAADADFANYQNWTQTLEPQKGPDPAGIIGGAHAANDSNVTRYMWIQDGSASRDASGNFPIGTRLVKEMRLGDGTVAAVTAMVKRGGSFNASHRNWEWFLLDETGAIQQRGGDLLNNMCNSCHVAAAATDYVFTK